MLSQQGLHLFFNQGLDEALKYFQLASLIKAEVRFF